MLGNVISSMKHLARFYLDHFIVVSRFRLSVARFRFPYQQNRLAATACINCSFFLPITQLKQFSQWKTNFKNLPVSSKCSMCFLLQAAFTCNHPWFCWNSVYVCMMPPSCMLADSLEDIKRQSEFVPKNLCVRKCTLFLSHTNFYLLILYDEFHSRKSIYSNEHGNSCLQYFRSQLFFTISFYFQVLLNRFINFEMNEWSQKKRRS